MAKLVYGAGTSHTPMLAMPPEMWTEWANVDYRSKSLALTDGRTMAYQELEDSLPEKHEVSLDILAEKSAFCQAALDRLADDLEAANVDVVVIVGDDQRELFGAHNTPLLSVYFGEELIMHVPDGLESKPQYIQDTWRNYAMDDHHHFPAHPGLALDIIKGFIDNEVDVGTADRVADPERAGFGHAYGFVIGRLFKGRTIPVIPILLNTYYPPNVPSASRCFTIGQHLRAAIEESPLDLRVAVIASGGLSHFVVDEALDERIINDFKTDSEGLRTLPREALRSGASEILNWVVAAGALQGTDPSWYEYTAVHRTPAGTGVGATFMSWTNLPAAA